MSGRLRRFAALSAAQRAVLIEAAWTHARFSAAAKVRPIAKLAEATLRAGRRVEGDVDLAWIKRAVTAASRLSPWRSVCLHRALTLHRMLRRRGVPSVLHYGISPVSGKFGAHMWVTLGDEILIGGETRAAHVCVAHFPREAGTVCPA